MYSWPSTSHLWRALGALHVDRERGQVPAVVGDAAGDHAARALVEGLRTSDGARDRCRARRMAWWSGSSRFSSSGRGSRSGSGMGTANSLSSSSMPTWASKGKPSTVGSARRVRPSTAPASTQASHHLALLVGRVQERAAGQRGQLRHDAVGAPVRGAGDDQVVDLHHRGDAARQRRRRGRCAAARCPCRSRCRRRPRPRW